MIIRCPKCRTAYSVQNDQIYEAGRYVRCTHCAHVWHQMPVFEAFRAEVPLTKAPLAPKARGEGEGESLALSRQMRRRQKGLKVAFISTAVLLLSILSVMLLAQKFFEDMFPASKGFYALIGLKSEEVAKTQSITGLVIPKDRIERSLEDGEPLVLTFKGVVRNINTVSVSVPKIIVTLHDDKGVEIDRWPAYPEKSKLNPGEETKWVCRFFNPDLDSVFEHRIQFK
ncbi:MAG: hypothetical protein CMF60_04625 [Magnetococcales bacterium]|nr:hypothetical protein [Magnetococcales bacterium]